MATVNVGDSDFEDVADAANEALRAGDRPLALRLDKLARKINAALSTARTRRLGGMRSMQADSLSWTDVDSVLRP